MITSDMETGPSQPEEWRQHGRLRSKRGKVPTKPKVSMTANIAKFLRTEDASGEVESGLSTDESQILPRSKLKKKTDKDHDTIQPEEGRQQDVLPKKRRIVSTKPDLFMYAKTANCWRTEDFSDAFMGRKKITIPKQPIKSDKEHYKIRERKWRHQDVLRTQRGTVTTKTEGSKYGKNGNFSSSDDGRESSLEGRWTITRPNVKTRSYFKEHATSHLEESRQQPDLRKKRIIASTETMSSEHAGFNISSILDDGSVERLDSLFDTHGRKSKEVKEMCADIIAQTKKTIETLTKYTVADIYPSYTLQTKNRIVFVITLKRQDNDDDDVEDDDDDNKSHLLIKEHIPFSTELRVLGCYPAEAKSVYKSEIVEPMSVKDQLKAKQCINMNCEELFKKHRYLSIITANTIRSRRFKTDSHIIDKQLCIVLFVHAKGFIPIDEEPFSDMYGEFAIDVLEGVFTPYVKTCKDYHDDVKMGCQISRNNGLGTLGGFIDHHKHGLVGFTCAHVLLNEKEFELCKNYGSNLGLDEWPEEYRDMEKRHVFQPQEVHNQAPLGQIVEAAYCPGGDNRSGIDAVLFRVENRFPLSGGCPSVLGDGENNPAFSFETGKICGPMPFRDNTVSKFGAETELTKGFLEFEVPFVCVKTLSLDLEFGHYEMTLLHQYQVRSIPAGSLFADKGDSGALVLTEDLDKKKRVHRNS